MEFQMTGVSTLTLGNVADEKTSKLIKTEINLEVDKRLQEDVFFDKDGFPTKDGTKALTQCFVQGIVGNIQSAHQKGQWDREEHIKYMMAEIERALSNVRTVEDVKK